MNLRGSDKLILDKGKDNHTVFKTEDSYPHFYKNTRIKVDKYFFNFSILNKQWVCVSPPREK